MVDIEAQASYYLEYTQMNSLKSRLRAFAFRLLGIKTEFVTVAENGVAVKKQFIIPS